MRTDIDPPDQTQLYVLFDAPVHMSAKYISFVFGSGEKFPIHRHESFRFQLSIWTVLNESLMPLTQRSFVKSKIGRILTQAQPFTPSPHHHDEAELDSKVPHVLGCICVKNEVTE